MSPQPEGLPYVVEPVGIINGEIGRPAALSLQEVNLDLGDEVALPNQPLARSRRHDRLFFHVSSDFSGFGRYAVITTAGDVTPAGIPQST
jgi:hypothetical protein